MKFLFNGALVLSILVLDVISAKKANLKEIKAAPSLLKDCGAISKNDTEILKYSWLVAFEFETEDETKSYPCSGVLINNRYVLTTATCLGKYLQTLDSWLNIVFNQVSLRVGVEDIDVHEEFNDERKANNIALVRLAKTIEVNVDIVKPICLPSATVKANKFDRPDKNYIAITWDYTYVSGNEQPKIRTNQVVPTKCFICDTFYPDVKFNVSSNQICVVSQDEGVKNGEMINDGVILVKEFKKNIWSVEGVGKIWSSIAEKKLLGRFTEVAEYTKWIHENIFP